MTIRTISDLPALAAQTTPISQAVKDFYANSVALGSGEPCGTFLTSDFFGTAAGIPGIDVVTSAVEILNRRVADGTLTALAAVYAVMKNTVSGDYGPPIEGPVIIPPGLPGAGTYNGISPDPGPPATPGVSAAEQAFQVLVPLAQSAIATAATAMNTDTATLNTGFIAIAQGAANEPANLVRAGIDFATLPAASQTSVLAFVTALPGYGLNNGPGESSEVLAALANTATVTGQAIVAALREGSNNQQFNVVGINSYNTVPLPDPPRISFRRDLPFA